MSATANGFCVVYSVINKLKFEYCLNNIFCPHGNTLYLHVVHYRIADVELNYPSPEIVHRNFLDRFYSIVRNSV